MQFSVSNWRTLEKGETDTSKSKWMFYTENLLEQKQRICLKII